MTQELASLLLLLAFNELLIVGVWISTDRGMIFEKLGEWIEVLVSDYWQKPLVSCLACMASVHSTYVYWSFMEWEWRSLWVYPFYVFALCGLGKLVDLLFPVDEEREGH